MANVPFLDLRAQYESIRNEVQAALREVCESCRFTQGPQVESFERSFATYCETEHCAAVNSGTSALHLAMRCLDIGPGDEVITVPMTFIATVWAISYVGATPVFVDIDPTTRTMDPTQLEDAITPKTKAILPVHLYGRPADMASILSIADRHGIPVVEDAAQAHGARFGGRRVGSLGRIGCFSFYPGKNLGGYGEGGALVTNDPAIAAKARMLRDHAQGERYRHETLGYNYRMDGFQGAVLDIKLRRLDEWNAARRRHASSYRSRLADIPSLTLPPIVAETESAWHLFVIESDRRDLLRRRLSEQHIDTGLHYPIPVHMQPAYAHLGLKPGSFPASERLAKRCLSLPMYAEITERQIDTVCSAIETSTVDRPAPVCATEQIRV